MLAYPGKTFTREDIGKISGITQEKVYRRNDN